jgi:cysteine desulfurase family protein (TIGR01976 family)
MSQALDIDFVRAQFPALSNGFAYLDNAGGSQVPQQVVNRISDYLIGSNVQTGASYQPSQQASARVLAARESMQQLINARRSEEVVMGGSTTLLMFMLCQAIAPSIKPGDEIILTNTDHEANIGAWERLQERGAVIKFWNLNPSTLLLDLDALDKLLSDKTRWVAMTHASNVLGTINPVAEVAKRVHAAGARLCVDAVAYAPHRLVDVQASGADCYLFSLYKVFGPHYAVLWGEYEFLRALPSLNHFFIGPEVLPYKLQPGNVNYELSYGCMGINDYLVAVASHMNPTADSVKPANARQQMQAAFNQFEAHEELLAERLLSWLRTRTNVRVIGQTASDAALRVPTISFVVNGQNSESIVRAVDAQNIGIRFGDFYAKRLIKALGLESQGGVVRVSIAHYNTLDEMDRLIQALEKAF